MDIVKCKGNNSLGYTPSNVFFVYTVISSLNFFKLRCVLLSFSKIMNDITTFIDFNQVIKFCVYDEIYSLSEC